MMFNEYNTNNLTNPIPHIYFIIDDAVTIYF